VAFRLSATRGLIDGLGRGLHRGAIPPPGSAQQIAELVHPTALMGRTGIHRLERRRQPGTAIHHDELELAALQAASMQIVKQALPRRLTLARAPREGQPLPAPLAPDPLRHSPLHPRAPARLAHPETDSIEKQIPPVIGQPRLVKLRHRLVQVLREARHRGGTDRFLREQRHDTSDGAGIQSAEKRLPNQQPHLGRAPRRVTKSRSSNPLRASARSALDREPTENVLPTLPGVLGQIAPELLPDLVGEMLPRLRPRCERGHGCKPSFGGEWVRLISAQLTPFVFYTEKITSPI
jgi:hypothetical protein